MAAVYADKNRISGLFKKVYGDLNNLVPSFSILKQVIPFKRSKRHGDAFEEGVRTRHSAGVTYLPSGAGVRTLGDPIATKILMAQVKGSQIYIRDGIDDEAMLSAQTSEQAFESATKVVVDSLWESAHHRLEVEMLWGADIEGLGIVESVSTNDVKITAATWAPGLWIGTEGHEVNVYSAPLSGNDLEVSTTITSIDYSNRILTLAAVTDITAGDIITFKGQYDHANTFGGGTIFISPAGLSKIAQNTGTLFGIAGTESTLWKGNVIDAASGPLTLGLILKGAADAMIKGAMGGMVCYVSPLTFASLTEDEASLRRYVEKGEVRELVTGAEKLSFYAPLGKIAIEAHPMMKQGAACGIAPKFCKRIGVTDVTFVNPEKGADGKVTNYYFIPINNSNGWEIRTYSHQAIYTAYPGRSFWIKNIVNP